MIQEPETIFSFSETGSAGQWTVVNDGVMGGKSEGRIAQGEKGTGVFSGRISLENSGGFSSIRLPLANMDTEGSDRFLIRLKGDGNRYQFRIRANRADRHSYAFYFDTSGDWEDIEVPMKEMFPTWRGFRPNIPNYSGEKLSEVGFLIGNKKEETFRLEIKTISMK